MRILAQPSFRVSNADLIEQLHHARFRLFPFDIPIEEQPFSQKVADRPDGIDVRSRVLIDHRVTLASEFQERSVRHREHVITLKEDRTGRSRSGPKQAHDRTRRH